MGFGVEAEEGCRDLVGTDSGVVPVACHLPFARTGQTVRIDGEQATLKVAAGTTEATQGELKFFRLVNGMGQEQIVNALIGNNKGEAVEEFESFLAESSGGPDMHNSQSRFVDHLQGHAGAKVCRGRPGPARQQIPRAQA